MIQRFIINITVPFFSWVLIPTLILTAVFFHTTTAFATKNPDHKQDRLSLSAMICVNKAQALFQDDQIKEAIDILEGFLNQTKSRKNKNTDIHYLCFLLGNYYSSKSHGSQLENQSVLEKAAQYYKKSLSVKPMFTPAWLNLARCCYEAQNFKDAAMAFEKGYEHSNDKKALHLYYAAVCHFQAKNSKKALVLFSAILKDHPDKVMLDWKEVLVNILFSLDRYKQALPHIEELAQKIKPPKQKQWQEILFYQYLNLEMDAKALSFAKYLTRTDPQEPKWWKGLSHVHLKDNHLDKGLSALVIYGFLTPMTPEELKLAADLYLSLEIPSKAVVFYENALKQVHDPQILKKLTQAFVMAFDEESALKWIDKGLLEFKMEKQSEPDLLTLKAQILYTRRAYEKAALAYAQVTQCAAKPRTKADAWLMRGYASMNCSQLNHADQAFKMAAKYKSHKKQAQKAIASIKAMQAYSSQRTKLID